MRLLRLWICLILLTISAAVLAQQAPSEVHHVSLCDVVRSPKEFGGMRIEVEASVVNDKGNSPMLTSNCQFGIRAMIDDQSRPERGVTEFKQLLKQGPIGTGLTDVSGIFIGTFEYLESNASYKLHLDRVEKMKIKRY